jgi:hypothetical protein
MWTATEVLTFCLIACQFGMMILAVFYLRRRALPGISYLLWGLLAITLPIIGPYLVIAIRPGEPLPNKRG